MLRVHTLLAVLAWTPALVGLGRLVRVDLPAGIRAAVAGLLGLGVLSAAAVTVSLFAPIGPWVSAALLVLGLVALARSGPGVAQEISRDALPLLGMAVLVSLREPEFPYDAGLYHLQSTAWARAQGALAGVANLHDRLGFNSAWLVDAAALELPGLRGASPGFAAPLVVVLAGWVALGGIRQVWRGDRSLGTVLLAMVGLPAGLALAAVGGTAPDPVVAVLVLAAAGLSTRAVDGPDPAGSAVGALHLASTAVAFKLSAAAILPGTIAALVVAGRDVPGPVRRRERRRAFAWSAALLAPWLVRGLVTSGCWLFPVAGTCMGSLPWAVPAENVQRQAAWIRSWARAAGQGLDGGAGGWSWLSPWASRFAADPTVQVLAAILVLGVAVLAWSRTPPGRSGGLLSAGAAVALAAWWATAPSIRLGLPYLLLGSVVPLALALRAPPGSRALPGWRSRGTAGIVLALSLLLAIRSFRVEVPYTPSGLPGITWDLPRPPEPRLRMEENALGARAWVPQGNDQCWDAPIPCTPFLAPRLRIEGRMMRVLPRRGGRKTRVRRAAGRPG